MPASRWRAGAALALLVVVAIVVVAGGVVTIVNPPAFSVSSYMRDLTILGAALALGLGGVRLSR